ncbi:MAG TPA: hypothetical protein VHG11_01460 [Pseudorhizobium sp.]|nr:hypothetical protein [Pseudorhizobium sp.]
MSDESVIGTNGTVNVLHPLGLLDKMFALRVPDSIGSLVDAARCPKHHDALISFWR